MASVKTVKLWGFKCLGYKEEGEVKILRRKILYLTRIKREQFQLYFSIRNWDRNKVLIYYQAFPVSAGIQDVTHLSLHNLTATDSFNDIAPKMNTAEHLFLVVFSTLRIRKELRLLERKRI